MTDGELDRLHAGGIRGIRFNFVKHLGGVPDLKVFYRLLARIKPLGWHVVLHFDADDVVSQRDLLGRIDVPFIIDHMGRVKAADGLQQAPFQALLALYRDNPLAWIKVCGAERVSSGKRPFLDAVPFAQTLIEQDREQNFVGHRLAASEHHQGHAERRRARQSVCQNLPGSCRAAAHSGGQSDADVLGS